MGGVTVERLEVGSLTFDARVEGPEDGPVTFLLHGWPQTTAAFDDLLPGLVAAGRRVVVPAQRGYSPDARPTDVGAYRLPLLAADVLGMAEVLGAGRFDVVGHDWGGAVAWALAAAHPERLRTVTSLSTPHPGAMAAAVRRSTQGLQSLYIPFFVIPRLPERTLLARGGAVLRRLLERSGLDGARAAAYAAAMAEPGALTAALSWYRAAARAPRSVGVGPSRVPTLYVWGSADPALGRAAAEATAARVEAPYRFVPLEGAGHWLPERHADEVLPVLLEHVAST